MALQRKRGRERNRHKHADRERTNPLPISPSIFMPVEPAGAWAFRVWEMTLKLNKYLSLAWALLNTSILMSSFYSHNSSVLTHVRVSHPISGTPTHFGLPKLFARKPHQQQQGASTTYCVFNDTCGSFSLGGVVELKELCCWKASVKKQKKRKTGPKMSQILPGDRWINGRSMNKHVRTRHTVCMCVRAHGCWIISFPVWCRYLLLSRAGTYTRTATPALTEPAAREDRPEHTLFECHHSAPMQRKGRKTKTKQNKKRGKQQNPTLFQRKK